MNISGLGEHLAEIAGNDYIDSDLYPKFNVKRGLRNADGTGVLVGLTRVGDVHGYIIDEGDKIAVPGKLYYRGIDVEDIVSAASREGRFCLKKPCTFFCLAGCRLRNNLRILTLLPVNSGLCLKILRKM